MAVPQSVVNNQMAAGVPGEAFLDGPTEAGAYTLQSSGVPNIIGATAYTVVSEGIVMAGGTGAFAGILANPKVYATGGQTAGPLTPDMQLADGTVGELVSRHPGLFVTLPAACNIGDKVIFNNATGVISTLPPATAVPGGSTLVSSGAQVIRFALTAAGVGVIRL